MRSNVAIGVERVFDCLVNSSNRSMRLYRPRADTLARSEFSSRPVRHVLNAISLQHGFDGPAPASRVISRICAPRTLPTLPAFPSDAC
jgi:hypothetical protein